MNEAFHNRGQRVESQVKLLRQLWSEPLITFEDRWHYIPGAGLNPLPVQRPIPLWFGGHAPQVLKRVAELGDGWMPNYKAAGDAKASLDTIHAHMQAAGRQPEAFGLEPRLAHGDGDPAVWTKTIQEWEAVGATHLSFNTMGCGFDTPAKHLAAVESFAKTVL